MSRQKPKSKAPTGPEAASRRATPVMNNVTGRVTHDDLGNAVWEWAISSGAFTADGALGATQRLRKLHNPALSLAEDAPTPFDVVKKNPLGTTKGYSPYDSGLLGKKPPSRKKDLRRLSEWLRLKKQAEKNKTGAK